MPNRGCNCSACAGGCILQGHPLQPTVQGGDNGIVVTFPENNPPQGSPKCRALSEFNPKWHIEFTPLDPDDCTVAWFVDTLPGGTMAGPPDGATRIVLPELVKANDCPVYADLRYNEPSVQEGPNNLFLRLFDGNSYSLSYNFGIFDPQTNGPSEVIVDTDLPTAVVIAVQTSAAPNTSGQVPDVGDLPLGLYYVHFFVNDHDSASVLPVPDDKFITWEIWTKPHRGGDLLDKGTAELGVNVVTSLLSDTELQNQFKQLIKGGGSGEQVCFNRYIHLFDAGCNESDTTFQICIEPFAKVLTGEYLIHIEQSTNHEECPVLDHSGHIVKWVEDEGENPHTDRHPELNQFTAATAYYPGEDNGLWTYGSGRAAMGDDEESNPDEGNEQDSGEEEDDDTGVPDEPNLPEPNLLCHWTNIHIETAPPPTAPIHIEALRHISQATCHDESGDQESGDYDRGLLTPPAGTVLAGANQNFFWAAQPGATGYGLAVSSEDGSVTYFTGSTTGLSITATGLPTNGSKLWVGFVFDQDGTIPDGTAWEYIAAGGTAPSVTHSVCMNVEIVTGEQDQNCQVTA